MAHKLYNRADSLPTAPILSQIEQSISRSFKWSLFCRFPPLNSVRISLLPHQKLVTNVPELCVSHCRVQADCCPLEAAEGRVSGYGLLRKLTQPCLYNAMVPPGPLNISTRIYIYNSHSAENLVRTFWNCTIQSEMCLPVQYLGSWYCTLGTEWQDVSW
jgi:hypothetical protein